MNNASPAPQSNRSSWAGSCLAIALAVTMLSACGGANDESTTPSPVGTTPTTTTTPTSPTTPSPEPSSRWIPAASTTWQWQLKGTLNLSYSVDAYDVDLFDTPASTIAQLHSSGRKVICYFSAGSSEDWRDDYASFKAADMGNALDGWPGERWLDISSANVRSIMAARLDLAQSKGCDGVEPDNVDGYTNSTGLALTAQQQLDYNRFLATQAHARNLAIGLKNDVDQLAALAPDFDFAVNEQCHEYDECDGYSAFTQANKPVFVAEYKSDYRNNTNGTRDALCASSLSAGLHTLVLPLELDDSFRSSCD